MSLVDLIKCIVKVAMLVNNFIKNLKQNEYYKMIHFHKDNYLFDWISCIITDRIYFGPIPNEDMFQQLLKYKFNIVVNLTENDYKEKYKEVIDPSIKIIHFPIIDKSIPSNIQEYCKFIISLKKEYENETNKIYIHCLAGHSRSSLVVTSLLCCIYNKELKYMIDETIQCHQKRIILRDIWRYRSPFNYKQFMFLCLVHKNIYIDMDSDNIKYNWLLPKNIWINRYITLDDYIAYFKTIDYDMLKNNIYLSKKISLTYLKKINFISKDKNVVELYNNFYKNIREEMYNN